MKSFITQLDHRNGGDDPKLKSKFEINNVSDKDPSHYQGSTAEKTQIREREAESSLGIELASSLVNKRKVLSEEETKNSKSSSDSDSDAGEDYSDTERSSLTMWEEEKGQGPLTERNRTFFQNWIERN